MSMVYNKDWEMTFDVKNCKVLQTGHNNAYNNYSKCMDGEGVQTVTEQTDFQTTFFYRIAFLY